MTHRMRPRFAPKLAISWMQMPNVANPARSRDIDGTRMRRVPWTGPRISSAVSTAPGLLVFTGQRSGAGAAGTAIEHVIYNQEEAKYDVLTGIFNIGIYLAQPTICTWGTAEQRERFVKRAMRADEVWCQLFSDPAEDRTSRLYAHGPSGMARTGSSTAKKFGLRGPTTATLAFWSRAAVPMCPSMKV